MRNDIKIAIIILTVMLSVISCKEKETPASNNQPKDSTEFSDSDQQIKGGTISRPIADLIYETDYFKLFGDSTIDKIKISYAVVKFEPYIGFEDFKVDIIDHRKSAVLDLKSNKDAINFKTRLREEYSADTANFAGHYTFVYWGCGSPCYSSLLIDRKTGKIYNSPGASLGYDFRVNSRMLIVNPPDSQGFYDDCAYCKPMIFVFDEKTKTFNERLPRK